MAKTYADSYIYQKFPDYGREMYKFIVSANRIDTKSTEFENILFDVKRRKISDKLAKVITSDNVVIGISDDKSLPKAYRVFVAQDVKVDKKYRVFIDATDFISYKDGNYTCKELSWLISYVISGITRSIPSISSSGKANPQSTTTILFPYSKAVMFIPICSRPPSGTILSTLPPLFFFAKSIPPLSPILYRGTVLPSSQGYSLQSIMLVSDRASSNIPATILSSSSSSISS